jgi:nitrite reductase/ring-hydroxylating ferredoxin subunit/uncharacterized membrane protein
MPQTNLERVVDRPLLDQLAKPLSEGVKGAFQSAGATGRAVKDGLHGTWLGHPLHPVLTDIPIGAWTTAVALDAQEAATGDQAYGRAADFALGVGLIGALGAAVTGLTDWSETYGRSQRAGLVHGLLNATATALVATGYVLRKNGSRSAGKATALAGFGIALGSAYLGGELVYRERLGVTHAVVAEPEHFTPVLDSDSLPESTMRKATIEDASFLVVRQHGEVCALAHSCAHMGGPLSEGTLNDGSVVCPWHGSEFALDDGRVMKGPSTHPQPCFAVREREGRIALRASNPGASS